MNKPVLSIEQKEVYHAARPLKESGAQQSGVTGLRLRGRKRVCSMKGQRTGVFASPVSGYLGSSRSVGVSGRFKDGWIIGSVGHPHDIQVGWEADEVPSRSFFDFLPPNWTCARIIIAQHPDEGIWNYLRRVELGNVCCANLDELHQVLIRAKERLRHKKEIIKSFSRQCGYSV